MEVEFPARFVVLIDGSVVATPQLEERIAELSSVDPRPGGRKRFERCLVTPWSANPNSCHSTDRNVEN